MRWVYLLWILLLLYEGSERLKTLPINDQYVAWHAQHRAEPPSVLLVRLSYGYGNQLTVLAGALAYCHAHGIVLLAEPAPIFDVIRPPLDLVCNETCQQRLPRLYTWHVTRTTYSRTDLAALFALDFIPPIHRTAQPGFVAMHTNSIFSMAKVLPDGFLRHSLAMQLLLHAPPSTEGGAHVGLHLRFGDSVLVGHGANDSRLAWLDLPALWHWLDARHPRQDLFLASDSAAAVNSFALFFGRRAHLSAGPIVHSVHLEHTSDSGHAGAARAASDLRHLLSAQTVYLTYDSSFSCAVHAARTTPSWFLRPAGPVFLREHPYCLQ